MAVRESIKSIIFSNGDIPELEIVAHEKEDVDKLIGFMMSN
jgi:hypothetical protein